MIVRFIVGIYSEESYHVKKQVSALYDTWDSLSSVSESAETWLAYQLPSKAHTKVWVDMHIIYISCMEYHLLIKLPF